MRTGEVLLADDSGNIIIKAYHSVLPPQKRPYQAHHHTECELSFFLRGSGMYRLANRQFPFQAGDVFLFGSNEAHCITELYEDMDLLNIHFEPRILWEHLECGQMLNLFTARSEGFSNRFPAGDNLLSENILALETELRERRFGYIINAKYLLFSALVHMIRNYDCIDPRKALNAHNAPLQNLKVAMQYIHQHLREPITLPEIAQAAHLTPTYFSALFKKFNGVSPWKYITIKRVELAINLLKTTTMTKLEIAEQCGFSSSSNFYAAFGAVTGKNPSYFTAVSDPPQKTP